MNSKLLNVPTIMPKLIKIMCDQKKIHTIKFIIKECEKIHTFTLGQFNGNYESHFLKFLLIL
jgi:hypothetical protein